MKYLHGMKSKYHVITEKKIQRNCIAQVAGLTVLNYYCSKTSFQEEDS